MILDGVCAESDARKKVSMFEYDSSTKRYVYNKYHGLFSNAQTIDSALFSDCWDEEEWCKDVKISNCDIVVDEIENPNIFVKDVCKRTCKICNTT